MWRPKSFRNLDTTAAQKSQPRFFRLPPRDLGAYIPSSQLAAGPDLEQTPKRMLAIFYDERGTGSRFYDNELRCLLERSSHLHINFESLDCSAKASSKGRNSSLGAFPMGANITVEATPAPVLVSWSSPLDPAFLRLIKSRFASMGHSTARAHARTL